eukprot:sb/3466647/
MRHDKNEISFRLKEIQIGGQVRHNQEATEYSVRFGSVIRCFFGGSVRFGSVENFDRTTEFFVQKMARNWAFSAIIFQLFHENFMDFRKVWYGSVRFGNRNSVRFGSVKTFFKFGSVRFGGKKPGSVEATEYSVRFGSVIRCFFGGSVRFGSVENFDRTTEFFVQKMARNWAFSAIIFQLFHENFMDFRKIWYGSVRFGNRNSVRFGSVKTFFKFGSVRFGGKNPVRSFPGLYDQVKLHVVYTHGSHQEATEYSVRFGSVIRCFFGGSVRFGSVENFDRTTEFFVQKMARNWAFSAIIFQLFHENFMDFRKIWYGSVRFGNRNSVRFGSVR